MTGRDRGAGVRPVKVGPSARASRAPDRAPLTARPPARCSAQVLAGEGLAKGKPGQKRTLRPVLPAVDPGGSFGVVPDQARLQARGERRRFAEIRRFTRQHRLGWPAGSGERVPPVSPNAGGPSGLRGIVVRRMSPTVFRDGPFRFFFFSREEERLHIHVQSPDGEAKFWIEPQIELARNYELSDQDLSRALQLVVDHE